MAQLVTGTAPLSYQGVQSSTPPQFFTNYNRAPGVNDTNFPLGTMWLYINKSAPTYELYMLVAVSNPYATGVANWSMLFPSSGSGITTINTNSGSVTGVSTISLLGTVNQTTTSATGSTINIGLPNAIIAPGSLQVTNGLTVTAGGATVTSGGLTVSAGGLNVTGTATLASESWGALVANGTGVVSSAAPSNAGYVLTSNGATSLPTFQPNGGGGGGIVTLDGDTGSATGNPVTIAGGTGMATSATGSTVTVNLSSPVAIAHGGTNATSMATTDGVVYYDGTRLVTTAVGSATQVLTSNGAGMAPTFQAAGGGGAPATACNFYYYLNNSTISVTGDGTNYTITGLSRFFDVGSNFDGTTFTAPNTGYYILGSMLSVANNTGSSISYSIIRSTIIGSVAQPYFNQNVGSSGAFSLAGGAAFSLPLQASIHMTAGDTITFHLFAATTPNTKNIALSGNASNQYTYVYGYQIA